MNEQPNDQPEPRNQPSFGPQPSEQLPRQDPVMSSLQPNQQYPDGVEPTPLQPLVAPPSLPDPGKTKPRRRKGIILAIIIAVIVVLGAGAAAAYKFWYQNPQKVVGDALMHALEAKTVKYTGAIEGAGETSGKITFNGGMTRSAGTLDFNADLTKDGQHMTLKGGGIYDEKGDAYVKLSNVDELLKGMGMDVPAEMQLIVDGFVARINDKWIKISADDLKQFSPELGKMQACLQDAVKKFQDDDGVSNEIVELYKKHPFLKVEKELGSKDGSLGYEMSEDADASKEFASGLEGTTFYKTLHDCDNSLTLNQKNDAAAAKDSEEERIELWVSRWSHETTKITVFSNESKPDDKSTLTIQPTFNEEVSVATPKESKSLKELSQDFQALQMAIMMQQMKAQGTTMDMTGSGFSSEL